MKILIISDGKYGDRAVVNIKDKFPNTELIILPEYDVNEIIDEVELDPETIEKINLADLLITYHRHPDISYEICSYEKPVIQAIYNGEGFLKQIRRELNADVIMPSSMCHLSADQENEIFNKFAKKFGMPVYEVKMRENSDFIEEINLITQSPCGSTKESIKVLIGKEISEEALNQFALTVRQECREPVSYVLNRAGVAEAATVNHLIPLIKVLKKIRPALFEKGGKLDNFVKRLGINNAG